MNVIFASPQRLSATLGSTSLGSIVHDSLALGGLFLCSRHLRLMLVLTCATMFFLTSYLTAQTKQVQKLTRTPMTTPASTTTADILASTSAQSVLKSTIASISTINVANVSGASLSLRSLMQEKQNATTANIPLFAPFRPHGRLFMTSTQAFVTIDKNNTQWQDYTGFPDLLAERLPAFPLFLGLQGSYNHLSILGASPRDVAVMMNGRPMRNVALGATYLEQLPPEMAEQTEVYLGSDAVLLANNASGAAINIQEIRHNTKNLYTRIWYQQFGDQFTAADVDASYNIAPNLNLTLGARTQKASRIYNNTASSLWNARMILRWNLSSTASISFSYLLTQQRVTANGGLQVTTATANVVNSLTLFNELQENTLRHDLTLTGSGYLTRDSSIAAALSAYTTWDGRALERASLQGDFAVNGQTSGGGVIAPDETIIQSTTTNVSIGATGRIETRVSLFSVLEATLLAGGNIALHSIPESIYWSAAARQGKSITQTQGELSAFGRLGFTLLKSLDVSGGVRLTIVGKRPQVALGAKGALYLTRSTTTSVQLWGDFSQSFRLPSPSDDDTAASFGIALQSELHTLGLAGLRFQAETVQSTFSSDILAFGRSIKYPILYDTFNIPQRFLNIPPVIASSRAYNDSSRTIFGASVSANWHGKNMLFGGGLVLSGFANLTLSQTDGKPDGRFPLLYAGATVQYEYVFGRDVLRAGVRVRMTTPFVGERFSPMLWSYLPSSVEQGLAGNGIDIVAGAEVFGSLNIRLTYQNALNSTAFTVAGYPQYPTVLRFTISATILGN
ncbi:MAG: TonB-dependent receptor plug domain-containing protein [Ignavibacteria bacterium]|nr:TonB-dependent receptor plug domain-containing protein [Ignavibacteria bacterium]